jgi:hypothetical protein
MPLNNEQSRMPSSISGMHPGKSLVAMLSMPCILDLKMLIIILHMADRFAKS